MLKLLVALDGSDAANAAARLAAALADRGTQVEALLVNAQPPVRVGEVGTIAPMELARSARIRARHAVLGPACLILRRAGVAYSESDALGDPIDIIVEEANAHLCDAILMGARRMRPIKRFVARSVSNEVLRRAVQPLTLVTTAVARTFQDPMRILVAVDGSPSAGRATRYAARLAGEVPRCVLHMVYVQPPLTVGGTLVARREELLAHWAASEAEMAFAEPMAILGEAACPAKQHVEAGAPASRILTLARELSCDLIVMGTRGLGRVEKLVLGSVADAVVREVNVPVALVR